MITPEELRDLVLYRKELLLPTTEKKKFGSAIMLLTPNYESTKNMMNLPYITDKFKSYESYYMEKNVMRYINTEGKLEADNNEDEYLHEVSESELSSTIQESSNILLEENIQVDRDIMEKACADAVHGLNWCTMDDGAFYGINTATIIGDNYFSCGCFNPRYPEESKQKIMDFLHRNKTCVFDNDIRYNIEWEVREIDGREYAVGTITSMEAPTVHESTNLFSIGENQLSSKERKELDASDYGLPDKRKYPMPDAAHVQSAIRFFNYVSEDDEPELARNIIKKAKKFNVPIRCGKKNRLSKYLTEETAYEGFVSEDMYGVINGTIKQHIAQMNNPDQYDYVKSTQYPFTKRKKKVKKVIQERVNKKCTCGSDNVGVFFRGEPVYICKDCGKYLGVVPFHSNKKKKAVNENEEEPSTPINRVALACQDLIDLFDKKLDIKYDIVSIYPEEQGIVFAKAYDGESATAIKNYLNMNLQSMNPEYTVDFINATGDDIHQLGDYYIYVTYDGYKGISGIITNNMGNNIF